MPELLLRPYKEWELRTQQIMRAKAIDSLGALANKFVHFNGNDIPLFTKDLVNSGKWQLTFGSESLTQKPPVSRDEHSFLSRLAAEYKSCKDKDIKKNAAKQSQKVLIGNSLKKSRISLSGKTSEMFSSRVDVAKNIGRLRIYADEKRSLLSIVALDYSYSILQRYFQCSSKTVTAARVHCILFGCGGCLWTDHRNSANSDCWFFSTTQ